MGSTLIPQEQRDLSPLVEWQAALATFLNTLSSPRTAKAYQSAVIEAMDAMGVDYVADVTAPARSRPRWCTPTCAAVKDWSR